MTGPSFTELMNTCDIAILPEDHTLWIPYGFQLMFIPREEDQVHHMLFMPFINHGLFNKVTDTKRLVEFANSTATRKTQINTATTYKELAEQIDSWTKALSTDVTIPATVPSTDLAITNAARTPPVPHARRQRTRQRKRRRSKHTDHGSEMRRF